MLAWRGSQGRPPAVAYRVLHGHRRARPRWALAGSCPGRAEMGVGGFDRVGVGH
jgi:hypothetical protein